MRYNLANICHYVNCKIDVSELDRITYISTENMLPNRGGVVECAALPTTHKTQMYECDDILISNIRPYFKKIWLANQRGGCSNDVLVFRASDGIEPRFLYYILASDTFFEYSMATSKGTKMPRGDKLAIMKFEVPYFDIKIQKKITKVLKVIDDKITLNKKINNNLAA